MKTLPLDPSDITFLSAALKKLDFFADLSMGDLERLLSVTRMMEVPAGYVLFKKGDVGDALYIVCSGRVRVLMKNFFLWPAKVIAELQPGDVVGEMALIDQPYRTATVAAKTPAKLFVLLTSSVNELFGKNATFLKAINKIARVRKFELKEG